MTLLARAVLRAEVGSDSFPLLEALCEGLDLLETLEVISLGGASRLTEALAEELAAQTLAAQREPQ